MGVMIAFQGRLNDPNFVPEFVQDMQFAAKVYRWPSKTMAELVAEGQVTCSGLRGLTLYPHPKCEPMHLHFDDAGHFINYRCYSLMKNEKEAAGFSQMMAQSSALIKALRSGEPLEPPKKLSEAPPAPPHMLAWLALGSRHVSVHTQHAGADVHIGVCELLYVIKKVHASDLAVMDDGGYWETGDRNALEGKLALIDRAIGTTRKSLDTHTRGGSISLTDLLAKLNADLAREKDELH